jgi:endo-beta-N-acetylglucosaminidase D
MKRFTLFASLALASCLSATAQRTPTHPLDIQDAKFEDLPNYLEAWMKGEMKQPQGVSAIDDQFYISRVRPLERIKDGDYQVRQGVNPERKMCLWTPLDDPTSKWKALPRYCFEGDNFSLWSYIDIHGNWTSPWIRSSAGLTDVAHKNGVSVGCVMSIGYGAYVYLNNWRPDTYSRVLYKLTQKRGGKFIYAAPFVRLMKYYGINGIGFNSEFHTTADVMTQLTEFFVECHKEAKKIDWKFEVHWYDGTDDRGSIHFDGGLGDHNKKIFGDKDNIATDMLFANYNWGNWHLNGSVSTANRLGRSSFDYYAGFDIQGRALRNNNWSALLNNDISIGFWGAHSQSLIHQSATDDGTSDIAIQKAYLKKQELIFSGGNNNPGYLPGINTNCTLANSSLKNFHGLATFLTAKSTIQQIPFVSRFNLGNGLSFRKDGQVAFDHKWYNLNTQDFMPTWRWWITDSNDEVNGSNINGLVKAELTFDDAYWGGSCLSLSGQTDFSRVKLFKTMLEVQPDYEFSVTYKTLKGIDSHAKLFVALKDHTTDYKQVDLPATETAGKWSTFTVKASDLGLAAGDKVAMMGLVVENSPADYQLHVGEMALRNSTQLFNTATPTIKQVQVLRGRYNACDFKLQYASKDESDWEKTYNDEVGTWYYEIYFQQKGQKEQLLTATTSWAAYVVDAPMVSGNDKRDCRFGVRAVAPDGKQGSEIVWTPYQRVEYNQPLSDVVADRPVIKPGEEFTLKYLDEMVPAATSWILKDAVTGATVATAESGTSATFRVDQEGTYDLVVIDSQGKSTTTRGKVKITPEATGAVPHINTLTADKQTEQTGKPVSYTYDARLGEGMASHGLVITDPKMFRIPGDVQQGKSYSYALWFKADNFNHDKQGTNLINKNTIHDGWPHNNWGDLWVTIRPEWQGRSLHPANEVSFNTMGWTSHDIPYEDVMTTGYSVTPGVWNHIVVTHTDGNIQKIYFNGREVASHSFSNSIRREDSNDNRIRSYEVADIFIGGGGVYKSGFNGVIDEVQVWDKPLSKEEVLEAMKGYKEGSIPSNLKAYFTFEEVDGKKFKNLGTAGRDFDGSVVVTEGSGGENTSTAAYVDQQPDNNVLGFPGVVGTYEVKTTPTWELGDGRISSESDKTAVVTYAAPGKKNVTLKLKNGWGEDEKTVNEIVDITAIPDGISTVEAQTGLSVYPNPFVESVNMRFAENGHYTINILGATGSLLQSNQFDAVEGQVVNVAISGARGIYFVQVMKNGKTYKTLKVIKK